MKDEEEEEEVNEGELKVWDADSASSNADKAGDPNEQLYYVPPSFLKEEIVKHDEDNNGEISFKYKNGIIETKKILVDIVTNIMEISKDLYSISVDKEEPDKLRGISSSELHKAREHVQMKVDSNLNQLKSVIDDF